MTTVEDIVRKMEERFGQAERIWVMDRGMVREANIGLLRERQALYIVVTPKSQLRAYEAALAEKENWVEVEHGVEARLVDHCSRSPYAKIPQAAPAASNSAARCARAPTRF